MKVLLILVAGLVLLILGVAVVGVWLPKRHVVSRSASYRVTPEQLFSLIAGAQTWRPDVTKWETVSADGGRELTRETTGDGETITYEVLDRVPPVSLKRRIATENLPYAGTWSYALPVHRRKYRSAHHRGRPSLQSDVSVHVALCFWSDAHDGRLPACAW